MKKLLLSLLIIFFFFTTNAQKPAWSKVYEQVYGSEKEYQDQRALRDNIGYELYRLIGFKSFYTNGPSSFLQQKQLFAMDAAESKGKMVYTLSKKSNNFRSEKLYLTYWLDENDRVTKARFKGEPAMLAYLFLNYWPGNTDWTEISQFKKGTVAEKRLLDEKIVFNYKGGSPFIEISR